MPKIILVVDDNQIHAYAMRKMLEEEGYSVLEAHSGERAVELTREHAPDLLLLDVNLPDFDGFEVCRQVREWNENLPAIVFHTATSANETSHRRAMSVGATSFLTYPVAREQLLLVILTSIARSKNANAGKSS